jgi:hypothetical protein
MEFPYQDNDKSHASSRRIAIAVVAAVLLLLVALFCWSRISDRGPQQSYSGYTYYARVMPDPVVFDIDGVRIGDSLEKAKGHFKPCDESLRKTGQLGYRAIDVNDGVLKGQVILQFNFDDSPKVIAFSLTYPSWYFDAIVEAYTKKLGAEPYKAWHETYTTLDGKEHFCEVKAWNTTDGDFTLRSLSRDGEHGCGWLCFPQWQARENKAHEAERQQEHDRNQKQLGEKL